MKTTIAKLILGVPVTLGVGMSFGLKDHTPVREQKEIIEQVIDSIEPTKDTIPVIEYRELDWQDFVESTIWIESRGQDSAYNRKENAAGVLQIRPIMVREVNRVLRKHKSDLRFTLEDRWDRQKSIDMFDIMAEEEYCCVGITFMEFCETVARKWNGGGRGHKKKATLGYWLKIEDEMNKINLEL